MRLMSLGVWLIKFNYQCEQSNITYKFLSRDPLPADIYHTVYAEDAPLVLQIIPPIPSQIVYPKLRISHVIFIFCGMAMPQNMEITWKNLDAVYRMLPSVSAISW